MVLGIGRVNICWVLLLVLKTPEVTGVVSDIRKFLVLRRLHFAGVHQSRNYAPVQGCEIGFGVGRSGQLQSKSKLESTVVRIPTLVRRSYVLCHVVLALVMAISWRLTSQGTIQALAWRMVSLTMASMAMA